MTQPNEGTQPDPVELVADPKAAETPEPNSVVETVSEGRDEAASAALAAVEEFVGTYIDYEVRGDVHIIRFKPSEMRQLADAKTCWHVYEEIGRYLSSQGDKPKNVIMDSTSGETLAHTWLDALAYLCSKIRHESGQIVLVGLTDQMKNMTSFFINRRPLAIVDSVKEALEFLKNHPKPDVRG